MEKFWKYIRTFILLLTFLVCCRLQAQVIFPWDGHIFPFCTDENPYGITYDSGTRGRAGFPQQGSMGCLGSTPGPVWYYMQIDQPGDLLIYIEQFSLVGHVLLDVDFACWGPFEAESKRDFLQKLRNSYHFEVQRVPNHRPVNGDHSRNTGGYPFDNLVDCSFHPAGTEWCYIPQAESGEWYLLLITNFSCKPGQIHFERVDDKSTATTRCDVTVPIVINPVPKDLKQIDEHTSAICLYEEKALVTIELEPDEDFVLSQQSLRRTDVKVFANGKTYKADLVDGHFECEIDIENDTTAYYAVVDCPDPAFKLETEKHLLVRTADCAPDQIPQPQNDTIHAGGFDFSELKRGETPIEVDLSDSDDYNGINLADYDVVVDDDNPYVENVAVTSNDGILELTPKLRGDWCECVIPDSLTFQIRLIPHSGNGAPPIGIPITIGVERHSFWIARCFWLLVTIFGLLVLFFYLRALQRKPRFKKSAMVNPTYYGEYGNEVQRSGQQLREKSFPAWFSRWFLPGAEQNTIGFTNPKVDAITFVATRSGNTVEITKKSINKTTMAVDGYDPENDTDLSKSVKLGGNGTIVILDRNGDKLGYLTFMPHDEHDGFGYRTVLTTLMVLDVVSIAALLLNIIKSLL